MKKVNEFTGMPKMVAAFAGWMANINLIVITQQIVDGFAESNETLVTFKGTIQPLMPEKVQLKPDGQRSWQWIQVHCYESSLNLVTNDRIVYNDRRYKVMAVLDYSLNGFVEYHCIADYEAGA